MISLFDIMISLKCGNNHFKETKLKLITENDTIESNINIALKSKSRLRHLSTKEFTPIRIYIDYTTLDSQFTVDQTFRNKIKQIMELSKLSFESLLLVFRRKIV